MPIYQLTVFDRAISSRKDWLDNKMLDPYQSRANNTIVVYIQIIETECIRVPNYNISKGACFIQICFRYATHVFGQMGSTFGQSWSIEALEHRRIVALDHQALCSIRCTFFTGQCCHDIFPKLLVDQ